MRLNRLWLTDFRNYPHLDLELPEGICLFVGSNGEGKTNLLEAVFYLATMTSFRVSSPDALIRSDAGDAGLPERGNTVVRGTLTGNSREILVEAVLKGNGPSRFQVNRQPVRRRDVLGLVPISIFTPDDLALVKGSPSQRRRFLDDALIQIDPRLDGVRTAMESVLRQRNALLRQSGGRLDTDVEVTLDVWDEKLAEVGDKLAGARRDLVVRLGPRVAAAYDEIAGRSAIVELAYVSGWTPGRLCDALEQSRTEDLRRRATTVGPHRDELSVVLNGQPARTHASQGEQRSLALALRVGVHRELAEAAGQSPILLLDDVFSELDPERSRGVLAALESEQTLLTTAGAVPDGVDYSARFRVSAGEVVREA